MKVCPSCKYFYFYKTFPFCVTFVELDPHYSTENFMINYINQTVSHTSALPKDPHFRFRPTLHLFPDPVGDSEADIIVGRTSCGAWDIVVNIASPEFLSSQLLARDLCNAVRSETSLSFQNIHSITPDSADDFEGRQSFERLSPWDDLKALRRVHLNKVPDSELTLGMKVLFKELHMDKKMFSRASQIIEDYRGGVLDAEKENRKKTFREIATWLMSRRKKGKPLDNGFVARRGQFAWAHMKALKTLLR